MPFTVSPLLTAPQVTGHPLGLPGTPPVRGDHTRIKPIADARNPDARLRDGQAPTQFWRAVNGEPDPDTRAAPPSIMQITITRMLAAQNPPPQANPAPVPAEPAGDTDKARLRASISDADGAEDRLRRADAGGAPTAPGDQPASAILARRSVFRTLP